MYILFFKKKISVDFNDTQNYKVQMNDSTNLKDWLQVKNVLLFKESSGEKVDDSLGRKDLQNVTILKNMDVFSGHPIIDFYS